MRCQCQLRSDGVRWLWENRHAIEARSESTDGLRRQANFGNQYDSLSPVTDDFLDHADVDFCFSTPGNAVENEVFVLARFQCGLNLLDGAWTDLR